MLARHHQDYEPFLGWGIPTETRYIQPPGGLKTIHLSTRQTPFFSDARGIHEFPTNPQWTLMCPGAPMVLLAVKHQVIQDPVVTFLLSSNLGDTANKL